MRITNHLPRQVALFLIVTSCLSVAILTLLLMLLPSYPVSQIWQLPPGGAIGVAAASTTLGAVLIGDRLGRLILPALLGLYGGASALYRSLSPVLEIELPAEPFLLPVIPGLLLILLAYCCWFGNKRSLGRFLWRVGGVTGVIFGVIALIASSELAAGGALELVRNQATPLGAIAAIGLGFAFWLASTGQGGAERLRLSRSAMMMGLCAIAVTFSLAYQVTHTQEQARQALTTQWLADYSDGLNTALRDRVLMLERLIDSWARLDDRLTNDDLARDARILMADHPSLQAMLKINKGSRENWRFSHDPELNLWLEGQLITDDGLRWIRLFPERSETHSWLVPSADHPTRMLVLTRPVDSTRQYLVTLLDLESLIHNELPVTQDGIGLQVTGPRGSVGSFGKSASQDSAIVVAKQSFRLGENGNTITLSATDIPGLLGLLPSGILLLGLILAFVTMHERTIMEETRLRALALADENQRLRTLEDRNPDPVFVIDRERRFQRLNAATAEILGMAAGRLTGMDLRELINETTVPLDDLIKLEHALNQAMSGLTPSSIVLSFQMFGREPRRFSLVFIPILSQGETEGVFGVAREEPVWRPVETSLSNQTSGAS